MEWFPREDQPLGLQKGSVRAIISIGIVTTACLMFGFDKLSVQEFLTVTAVITGFYFGSRKS